MGSTDGDLGALERLLGGPEMSWLVDRVRKRILAADGAALSGVVRLDAPSPAQRTAVVKLVGPPKRAGASVRVNLAEVEKMLRRGPWPAGLADAVVTLTGPVVDRGVEREREAAAWERASEGLNSAAHRFPELGSWWESWCANGGLKRVARSEAARSEPAAGHEIAERLVGDLAKVLDSLPAAGEPLTVFARRVTGDAHGLDDSRPLGRLAAAAVGVAFADELSTGREVSRRDAWASAGVVMSNVSSTVLSLGVDGSHEAGDQLLGAATASALAAMRTARAPILLTLDQVRSGGVSPVPVNGVVHVCENPTVVEVVARRWVALDQRASVAPVLVCTSGQPSTAALELLEQLTADGAPCLYHGDFDWGGLRIARVVRSRIPWTPWRFTAADYREAATLDTSSLRLAGNPVDAPWDPDLAFVMTEEGRAIEEEAVAEILAADVLLPLS